MSGRFNNNSHLFFIKAKECWIKMKEKIKSAINNGLFDKDSVLDTLFDIVSEEQLIQNPKFSLLSGPSKSSEKQIGTSDNWLEGKVKELVHDAVFPLKNSGLLPEECRKGEWRKLTFGNAAGEIQLFFFTKDLKVWKSTALRNLMKSNGSTHLYCDPCVDGIWGRAAAGAGYAGL